MNLLSLWGPGPISGMLRNSCISRGQPRKIFSDAFHPVSHRAAIRTPLLPSPSRALFRSRHRSVRYIFGEEMKYFWLLPEKQLVWWKGHQSSIQSPATTASCFSRATCFVGPCSLGWEARWLVYSLPILTCVIAMSQENTEAGQQCFHKQLRRQLYNKVDF